MEAKNGIRRLVRLWRIAQMAQIGIQEVHDDDASWRDT
jgi:hypothetical protein